MKRGRAVYKDKETDRDIFVVPDDRTLDSYERHLILHGHRPQVLMGTDIADERKHLYTRRRRALLGRMEREFGVRAAYCKDVPESLTWAQGGTPLRLQFADFKAAKDALATLPVIMAGLKRGDYRPENIDAAWNKANALIQVAAWYFVPE